ncbi:MAG: tetratricopeptide repeat protein [Bacteroidales bacterium]|nr:MAG: tetratricopeptide repeat protein [Bacteroidales bacterium]
MLRFRILLIALLICKVALSQLNIADSFRSTLTKNLPDSIKIDLINDYITKYSPNDPGIALVYSDSAINLSLKSKDSLRLANSLNRKGIALYYIGDYHTSLENYFHALSVKEKIGENSTLWREYNNIGLVLRNLDLNEDALKYFNQALKNLIEIDNKAYQAIAWNNIGITYRGMGDYLSAKEALSNALEINRTIGAQQSIAHNLNNLGNVNFSQKKYSQAIGYFEKAYEINKSLLNNYEQVQNLNNLADVYLTMEQFSKSKVCLDKASEILKGIDATQLRLNNLMIYSDFFERTKDYRNAVIYKNNYIMLSDSISKLNRTKQFNQLKNLANAEKEIQEVEFLKKINSIQGEKILIQRSIQIGGATVILIILALLIIVWQNLRDKKKLNISLNERTYELEALNEEFQAANEELNTQRDNLEETVNILKSTQNKLIQSEKMASIGILAAGVAHEINNPLNFIHGGIAGIKSYFNSNSKSHNADIEFYVNAISEGVERASTIVDGLNHFSRDENYKSNDVDLHRIIDTCSLMLNSLTLDRIELVKDLTNTPFRIYGNEGKLHQAIMNVMLNAVQAIDGRGAITIKTQIINSSIRLEIKDTGCGINQEILSKVFDPFFTTKEIGQGTGLGLSITYNIIQEHNGSIDVESLLGHGTNVKIEIPLEKA